MDISVIKYLAPLSLAYIDPGTGSMLFTILIGAFSVVIYELRGFLINLRNPFSRNARKNEKTIPIAIFSDDKRYWNTFGPICRELDLRGQDVVYLTQSKDDPAFDHPYEHVKVEFIGEGNKGYARLNLLDAGIVLSSTPSLDVYQWKRSKNVKFYIHILHAANDATAYRMFGIDYFDGLILSGEFQAEEVRELERIRGLKEKEIRILGLPYLDSLKERADKQKQEHSGRTVLLAPSWGDNSILNKYGSKMIDALLETGYHIIVRPHPQSFTSEKELMDQLMKRYPDSEKLEWNRDNDNFDVLSRSDILISDYSGVVFDFSLVFDRPIIYADVSFDNSVYDAWWLDDDMWWTFKALPRLGRQLKEEDLNDIKDIIDTCIDSKEMQKSRDEVKKECWANIGNSASLIAEYLIDKSKQLTESKR